MSTQIEVHDGVVLDLEGATTLVEALRRWCAAVRDLAESNRDSDPQWAGDLVRVEHDVAALLDRYAPTGSAGDHATLPGPLEPMRQVEARLWSLAGVGKRCECGALLARHNATGDVWAERGPR